MPELVATAVAAIGVAEITASVIASAISWTLTLVSIGVSLVMAINRPRPKAEPLSRLVRTSDQPCFEVLGRDRVGGYVIFDETDVVGKYGFAQVINCAAIDGIDVWYRDDKAFTPTAGSFAGADAITLYPNAPGFVRLENATGVPSAMLMQEFPTLWTSAHRGDGLAIVYGYFTQVPAAQRNNIYPNGFPIIGVILRGTRIYDPRNIAQSVTNPATWIWSENPALHWAYYKLKKYHHSFINWGTVIAAANACDALVPTYAGATEKFARCVERFTYDEAEKDVTARILASCDGYQYEDEKGLFCVGIDAWEEPEVWLTDDDIASWIEDEFQGVLAEANYYHVKYKEPKRNYQIVEGKPVFDAASIAAIGRKPTSITLDDCPGDAQAYRVTTRHLRRQFMSRLQLTAGARGLLLAGQRKVGINSRIMDEIAVYDITGQLEPESLAVRMPIALRKCVPEIYANVVPPGAAVVTLASSEIAAIPVPSSPAFTHVLISSAHYLRFAVDAATDESLDMEAQYSLDEIDWFAMPTIISTWMREAGPVAGGGIDYFARARFITSSGGFGGWTSTLTLTVA